MSTGTLTIAQGGARGWDPGWILLLAFLVISAIAGVVGLSSLLSLYIQALLSGARVPLMHMIGMRLRKVDIREVVLARLRASKAGLDITAHDLETHWLAGGHVSTVVSAMIAARAARIPLTWDAARAIDLAGRDPLELVSGSVNPRVLDCPNPSGDGSTFDVMAQDGVPLKAAACVKLRTNPQRMVGGAPDGEVLARISRAIALVIACKRSHTHVLSDLDRIGREVLKSGLDAGTSVEVLGIDIKVRPAE